MLTELKFPEEIPWNENCEMQYVGGGGGGGRGGGGGGGGEYLNL